MCQLPPKKPNIEKKTKNFLTPTVSKKSPICEIWRQKRKSDNPGEPRRPTLFFSFADLWMTITILALLK